MQTTQPQQQPATGSTYLDREVRRMILEDGYLRSDRLMSEAGMRGGFFMYAVWSRSQGCWRHAGYNPQTGRTICDCQGHRSAGHCAHSELVKCKLDDRRYNRIVWPDLPEALERHLEDAGGSILIADLTDEQIDQAPGYGDLWSTE